MRLLTPHGPGGIAVLAAAGEADRARLAACLRRRDGRATDPSRDLAPGAPPRLCWLQLDGEVVDEVLALARADGGLELHLHGSPALVAAVERAFGPFEQPAPAPAERLLREALSPEQLALALEQRAFDFAAEVAALAALPPAARERAVAAALERSRTALALAEPRRVAITGRQNAGKSTLFNRLLLRERALTGPHAGLTRDAVAEVTTLLGYPYLLVDTPGEGEVQGVDATALERGRRAGLDAIRLVAIDRSRGPAAGDRELLAAAAAAGEAAIVLATKCDLPAAPWPGDVPCHLGIAAGDEAAGPRLRRAMGELLRERRRLPPAGRVGGFAALDRAQFARLQALAGSAHGERA